MIFGTIKGDDMYAIYDMTTKKFATIEIFSEFEDAAASDFIAEDTFIMEVILDEFNLT